MIKAWTDYPIGQLGDEPGKIAPIREIEVLSYDRNKYCWVRISGTDILDNFKAGYIYEEAGRCGEVKMMSTEKYSNLPYGIED